MKKTVYSILMAVLGFAVASGIAVMPKQVNAAGNIGIDETNFPDSNFRSYILSQPYGTDLILTPDEISSIKKIKVDNKYIKSLKGIEFFTSLERLECYRNNLSDLDVRNNTKLTYLDCSANQLTELDVSKNSALEYLFCNMNLLTDINLKENTALLEFDCSHNDNITSLDVSKNTGLKVLECNGLGLTELDVSNNTELSSLGCSGNELTGLDLKKNTNLIYLFCDENRLVNLDVSMNERLKHLFCADNQLEHLFTAIDPDTFTELMCDYDVSPTVLTKADWNYSVVWNLNESDPSKTTAEALFECTKEGATDYKVSEPMSVKVLSYEKPGCEKEGSASYEATLSAEYSRTGNAISESKTFNIQTTGHDWGEWKVTKKATIASEGEETRICKNDPSHKETRKIAKLTPTPTAKPTATPTAKPADNAILTLNKKSLNIVCAKTDSLKATLTGSTSKISWKSSDNKIATVDANGKLTTKMAGQVTITASAAGKKEECVVTVLYKDVTNSKDFWYAPTNYLTAKGVVKGYDKQTKFKPANDCTRAQMVTFLYRLQGEPKVKSTTCKFKDVKKTDYFYKPVIWASEKGITTGVSKDKFGPQGVCTRAQTVTFLWRMAKKPAPKTTKNKFPDVKKSDYFYKATLWASEKKILAGLPDGTFNPQGKCLRRQMVTFLYKYDKYVNKKG